MRALAFAWLCLVRQPARATLGILGVAAVGALLFDMLLLSEGLLTSMRDLFDRQGYDIRVTASEGLPGTGPDISDATTVAASIAALPSVRSAITMQLETATLEVPGVARERASFVGAGGGQAHPWQVLRGRDVAGNGELVLNEEGARELALEPGATVTVRATCASGRDAPPPLTFLVTGIARFPFEGPGESTAATTAAGVAAACGNPDTVDASFLLVTSTGDPEAAATAIGAAHPDLQAFTNEQLIGRLEQGGFSYFRQISTVLTTVTLAFALLLITVLLTVSVNQRLGEIAALRALGFSQWRVAADVFFESALLVGIGGLLSLPIGAALAVWLDTILKRMPGIPTDLHFFVFDAGALGVHGALLLVTSLLAALYPMRIVARLPIAATLRSEVVS